MTESLPVAQSTRNRIREQESRERDLTARILAAESRLAKAKQRRDAVVADLDRALARNQDQVADALIAYVETAGLGIERAAIVLGRPTSELTKQIRARRATLRANGSDPPSK